ncbi:MAG: thioredoxin fold domain-containing protein [Porticoccaceae bacterium]|nr:thioredoxin fold domain-containing protein [Porticoccaceae bacterium]
MKLFSVVASIGLFCFGLGVLAADKSAADSRSVTPEVSAAIIARLQSARSDLVYLSVETSPLPGIHQVQVENGPLLYVVNQGEYFFDGSLYQVRPGLMVNVRDMEQVGMRAERIAALDLNDMIIFSPAAETRGVLNVFTDVDCGFCRKLHQDVPQLNAAGIEVRYLAFPRAGIDSPSYKKIVSAWCAKDQRAALSQLKNGIAIEENLCEGNPVAAQYLLGAEMGVNGTPAIVLNDGTLIPGYRTTADFVRLLGL